MKSKRIYFAGKISLQDWRYQLFGWAAGPGADAGDRSGRLLDPEHTEDIGGGVVYGGPYFISDEHGCVDGLHGVGNPANGPLDDKLKAWGVDAVTTGKPITRADIYRVNCNRIEWADWVFAYIDSFTAYGTFFEIGYAASRAIPIALAFSPHLDKHGSTAELWMLGQAAKHRYHGLPKEAFEQFCSDIGLSWRRPPPEGTMQSLH